jgi:thioredoxin reductase (NADPH)
MQEYDLVIVGGGPAGLSAAINGASELPRVALCDSGRKNLDVPGTFRRQLGGQAVGSTAIENYPGFPKGLSGCDLMTLFDEQAVRMGADIFCPHHVDSLQVLADGMKFVTTREGAKLLTHTVLLTSGLSYNKLQAPGVENLLGHGVLYGSPTYPAEKLGQCTVCIVGAANSAGQAVMHLAQSPCISVKLLVRGTKPIEDQMSAYLVNRIRSNPRIEVLQDRSVIEVVGTEHLEAVRVRSTTGEEEVIPTKHLFIYIGASPKANWLGEDVNKDTRNFILTGNDLSAYPSLGSRLPFETALEGVFAAGDIRSGSVKRVASAVGEGSAVLASIHKYLANRYIK